MNVENSVIGCLMLSNKSIESIIDIVKPHYFLGQSQLIFKNMIDQYDHNRPFDTITLAEKMGELDWLAKLGQIAKEAGAVKNIEHYARLVKENYLKREIVRLTDQVKHQAKDQTSDQLINELNSQLAQLDDSADRNQISYIGADYDQFIEKLEKQRERGGKLLGLSTGLDDLDRGSCGLVGGNLVIIAARPAMGKTVLAENIATHNALEGKNVLFFSLEMPKSEIQNRCFANVGKLPLSAIRDASVVENDQQFAALSNAMSRVSKTNYGIDDTGGISITELKAKCGTFQRKHGSLDLIVVDYLQLVRADGKSRIDEVSEVSRQLKVIAKDFDCPVICLSQLNRSCEARSDKRPMTSDLRESGQIEQDADLIYFLYRDEVYDQATPAKGIIELLCAKNRNGAPRDSIGIFNGEQQRIEEAHHSCWDIVRGIKESKSSASKFDY